jgi:hypothetical protein
MPLPKTTGTQPTTAPKKDTKPMVAKATAPEGFREVVVQPLRAWDTPGQETVGYFLGTRPSTKYPGRKLLDLLDDDGVVTTWGCPVILEQLLLGVAPRTVVLIRYTGEEPTAKGETKHFQVFLGDAHK